MGFDMGSQISDSGYVVTLRKGHPLWEAFEQMIYCYLPDWVAFIVEEIPWVRKKRQDQVSDVLEVPITEQEAMMLARDLWEAINDIMNNLGEDDEDG